MENDRKRAVSTIYCLRMKLMDELYGSMLHEIMGELQVLGPSTIKIVGGFFSLVSLPLELKLLLRSMSAMYSFRTFTFVVFFIIPFCSYTQFQIGAHPSDIEWQQIDNNQVKVIYPKGQDQKAARIANLIAYMAEEQLASIGLRTKKIDLILQTNQVLSNGYAALSPYRTEFFGTPPQSNQFLGSIDWLDALTIHEYRHALQYTNANRGITRFFNILQGQNGWAVVMNLSVPDWFFEGDATMTETVLTNNGRGRTPSFFKEQRALFQNNRYYSYPKARNGSFKDLVPDHYRLGYTMMKYARNEFNPNIWANVLADAGRYRSLIYPFSGALKRHTGLKTPALYRASYGALEAQWNKQKASLNLSPTEAITSKPLRVVTNYSWPNFSIDSSIVYLKSSFQKTPAIYQLKDGRSEEVTTVGISTQQFLSEQNGHLAWTELRTDPRWANRSYSVIMTYDLTSMTKKELTHNTKFFSPEFSNSMEQIVAVEVTDNLQVSLQIIDAGTGKTQRIIKNELNDFISFPKWTADDQAIIYLAKRNSQLAFFRYNFSTDNSEQLTEWTNNVIGGFNLNESTLIYSGGHSGIDNLYAFELDKPKEVRQLTSVSIGAYTPDISMDGKAVIFSEFTDMGHQLSRLTEDNYLGRPTNIQAAETQKSFGIQLSDTEQNILESIPEKTYESKAYNSLFRGMKLHSWSFGGETSFTALSLQFQNILNDVQAELFSSYNINEESISFGGRLSLARWYTPINLSTNVVERSTILLTPVDTFQVESFSERRISAGLSLPLRYIRGNYFTNINLATNYVHRFNTNFAGDDNRKDNFGSIETTFSISNIRRRARQNVLPRFGQIFQAAYRYGLRDDNTQKVNLAASLFFPGLHRNHGIRIDGAFQRELLNNTYQFSDAFFYARGYTYPSGNDQASRIAFNYQLPLLYPDWGFAGLVYFKRVRANLFFDLGHLQVFDFDFGITQKSTGIELLLDNNYFNVLPITLGLRYAYKLDPRNGEDRSDFGVFFITDF